MEKNAYTEKEVFEKPTVEIIVFATEDVITTSGGGFMGIWDEELPEAEF